MDRKISSIYYHIMHDKIDVNQPNVASFPSPAQLSVTCSIFPSTVNNEKLGGAWEQG